MARKKARVKSICRAETVFFFVFSFYKHIFAVATTMCRERVHWMGPFNEILIKMRRLVRWLKRMSTIRRHVDVFCIYANFFKFRVDFSAIIQFFDDVQSSLNDQIHVFVCCGLPTTNYAKLLHFHVSTDNRMESGPFSIAMNDLYTNQIK